MILLEVILLALAAVPVIVAQVANCTDSKFTWVTAILLISVPWLIADWF